MPDRRQTDMFAPAAPRPMPSAVAVAEPPPLAPTPAACVCDLGEPCLVHPVAAPPPYMAATFEEAREQKLEALRAEGDAVAAELGLHPAPTYDIDAEATAGQDDPPPTPAPAEAPQPAKDAAPALYGLDLFGEPVRRSTR